MPLSDRQEPAGCSELYESRMMHWFSGARREGTGRSHCKNIRLLMTHAGRHHAVGKLRARCKPQLRCFYMSLPFRGIFRKLLL